MQPLLLLIGPLIPWGGTWLGLNSIVVWYRFQGIAAMRSGGRGRPRLRLGERGVMEPLLPPKRRLLPRVRLLPLLLALAVGSAFYTIWSGWHRRTEELPLGRELRVRLGGDPGTAGTLIPSPLLPRVDLALAYGPNRRCHSLRHLSA